LIRALHIIVLAAACLAPTATRAFSIVAPAADARVRPGEPLEAAVDVGDAAGVGTVKFYWYRDEQEPLRAQQATPALVASAADRPPYGGRVPVPPDALGVMRLLAVGDIVQGRMSGREEFDEITVIAEPAAPLERIEFETEKPMRLETVGKVVDVPAVGYFADGVSRPLYGAGTGSEFDSSDRAVVDVSRDGKLRVVGNGAATVTVRNRGQTGALRVVVKSDSEPNTIPIANAGEELTVRGGATVILNGLRSVDPDGDPGVLSCPPVSTCQ